MDRRGIDTGGIRKTRRAFHEGLVAKNDVAEAAIIGLSPENIAGLFPSERDEAARFTVNIACSKDLPERALSFAGERRCGLRAFRKRFHVSRDTAVDDNRVPCRDLHKGNGGGEPGAIIGRELHVQRWQVPRSGRHRVGNRWPLGLVDMITPVPVLVVAFDKRHLEGRAFSQTPNKADNASGVRSLVDEVTGEDQVIARIHIEHVDKGFHRIKDAVDIADDCDFSGVLTSAYSGMLSCFFQGFSTSFVRSARRDLMMRLRVEWGRMMSSI